jgi:hypothetical protein
MGEDWLVMEDRLEGLMEKEELGECSELGLEWGRTGGKLSGGSRGLGEGGRGASGKDGPKRLQR